jgi:hypothetical protein
VVSVGLIQSIIAAAVRCSPVQVVPDDQQWVESLQSSVNTCKDGKFGKSQKAQFFLVQQKNVFVSNFAPLRVRPIFAPDGENAWLNALKLIFSIK